MSNLSLPPLPPVRLRTSPAAPLLAANAALLPAANVAPAAKKAPPISNLYGSFVEGLPRRPMPPLALPKTPPSTPPPPQPQVSPTPPSSPPTPPPPPPTPPAAHHSPSPSPSPRPSPKVPSPEPLASPKAAGIGLGIGAAIGAVVGLVEAREKNLSALDTLATMGKSAVGTLFPIATIVDPNQPLLNRVAAVGTTAVSAVAGLALFLALFGVSSPALAVVGLIGGVVAIGASLGQDAMHLRNPEANPTGGIITSTARLIKRVGALVNNSQAPAVATPPQPRQERRTRQDTSAPQIPSEPAPTRSCVVNNLDPIRIFNDNNKELFVRLDKADKAFCVVDNLMESGKISEANLEDDGRIRFVINGRDITFSDKDDLKKRFNELR